VIGYTGAPTENDSSMNVTASRDSNLGTDYRVRIDANVVTDLHLIIDLHMRANDRRPHGSTVDGRAGPNLNMVAYLDVADLGHLANSSFRVR
jgi:hypothetical protein